LAARTHILNGLLQGNLDANNFKILNLDTSNLSGLGTFGNQPAHYALAGPVSGSPAAPTFRQLGYADLTGVQAHDDNLDLYAAATPTESALAVLNGLVPAASDGYLQIDDLGFPTVRTFAEVLVDVGAQPLNANLTEWSSVDPTTAGKNVSRLVTGGTVGYLHVNNDIDTTVSLKTAAQLAADISGSVFPVVDSTPIVKGSATSGKQFRIEVDGWAGAATRVMTPPDYNFTPVSLTHAEELTNKVINGLTMSVGDTPSPDGTVTYDDTPSSPYNFQLVSIGGSGLTVKLQAYNPTSLILPTTGTLATVAGTIPWSYFDTKVDLGGKNASDAKSPSQKAVYEALHAHSASITPAPALSRGSATSLDLTSFPDDYQISITGTTDIEAVVMNEGEEHLLSFTGILNLVHSAGFPLPGGTNLKTRAGSYIVVRAGVGADAGKTFIIAAQNFSRAGSDPLTKVANFIGGSITELTTFGLRYTGGSYDMLIRNVDSGATGTRRLDFSLNDANRAISLGGDVTTGGTFITQAAINFAASGSVGLTLPLTGTVLAEVSAPATASSAGVAGQIAFDSSFGYRCTATNTWKRWALSSF
jgi:hypothetical protein